jgi:hypothetical protein
MNEIKADVAGRGIISSVSGSKQRKDLSEADAKFLD